MLDIYRNWLYSTRFSKFVSKLVKSKISPNFLTTLGLISGIVAAYLIYKQEFLISIIFIVLTSLCDLCDGWVARLSNKTTKFGIMYDVTIDKYVEGIIALSFVFIAPTVLIPGYAWVVIAVFGSIIISLIYNVGLAQTKIKPFKLASRLDRGILFIIGLILATFLGNIYLTYTIIVIAVISHLTAISMLFQYRKILK